MLNIVCTGIALFVMGFAIGSIFNTKSEEWKEKHSNGYNANNERPI